MPDASFAERLLARKNKGSARFADQDEEGGIGVSLGGYGRRISEWEVVSVTKSDRRWPWHRGLKSR